MKIFIETLGCPKNTVDSESMSALLLKGGHFLTEDPGEAEVLIVNTCAFIRDAKEESIETIFDLAEYKGDHKKLLIVTGCLSQRYVEDLFEEMPEVDAFLGVNDYQHINEVILKVSEGRRIASVHEAPELFEELDGRAASSVNSSAYLRIAEGCDNACTYCIIPSIRGPYRSRRMEDILAEAEQLAGAGIEELVLIAQDVSAYGLDLYGELALHKLLRNLCGIDGLRWIRLLYCYEDSITDELIDTIRTEEKICNYIDIPLQHINDRVLSAMNRHSTSASIRNTIRKLRTAIPDIHIRTTFITGFPGETEEEFAELQEFVEEMEFERLGVFPYSLEENTPAALMTDQVDEEIRSKRADSVMEIQQGISLLHNQRKIGSVLEVLVEEKNEEGTYTGRTVYDAPEIDNGVIFTSERELSPGDFVPVLIMDAFDYDLAGRLAEEEGSIV